MAVEFVGSANGTTSVTLPAHQAGDLILIYAFRNGSTTSPSLASGYTSITFGGSFSASRRLGYKIASGSSETSGTWSNATGTIAHVYRGVNQSNPIGAQVGGFAQSLSVGYPALTLVDSEKSWVAGFAGRLDASTTLDTPPDGMAHRQARDLNGIARMVSNDTGGVPYSWPLTSVTVEGDAQTWLTNTVEIRADGNPGTAKESGAASVLVPDMKSPGVAVETGYAGAISASAVTALISMPSPLSFGVSFKSVVYHDWSAAIPESATITWGCDLLSIEGVIVARLPISSWQATLQTGRADFLQAVVPGAAQWAATIAANPAGTIVISRKATLPSGQSIEQEIARAPINEARMDRGPTNYTFTLTGYATNTGLDAGADAASKRTLSQLRSISVSGGNLRVRCAIDWFLRPGQLADANGTEMTCAYINYYVNTRDAYMDVGERAA